VEKVKRIHVHLAGVTLHLPSSPRNKIHNDDNIHARWAKSESESTSSPKAHQHNLGVQSQRKRLDRRKDYETKIEKTQSQKNEETKERFSEREKGTNIERNKKTHRSSLNPSRVSWCRKFQSRMSAGSAGHGRPDESDESMRRDDG